MLHPPFTTQALRQAGPLFDSIIKMLALVLLFLVTVLWTVPLLVLPFTKHYDRIEHFLAGLRTWTDMIINGKRPPT